jgi:hypothetical protein
MGEANLTTGVKTFSSDGMKTQKFDNTPPAPKEYDAVLNASGVAIANTSDGRPYIQGVRFELKGTASVEGGRNRTISATFWLDTKAFKADGTPAVGKADGIVPLARAMGEEVSLPEIVISGTDAEGNARDMDMLDPRATKAWFQQHDGKQLRLKTKLRPDRDDPKVKYGAVHFFIEQQTSGGSTTAPVADDIVIP